MCGLQLFRCYLTPSSEPTRSRRYLNFAACCVGRVKEDEESMQYYTDLLPVQEEATFITYSAGDNCSNNMTIPNDVTNPLETEDFYAKFVCAKCGKMYSQKRNLTTHMRLECGMEPQFVCPRCKLPSHGLWSYPGNTRFEEQDSNIYSTYANVVQNNKAIGQFKCPRCSKTYRHYRTLKRHLKLECGKQPQFQCPFCPRHLYGVWDGYTDSIQFPTFEQIIKEKTPEAQSGQVIPQSDSEPKAYSCPICGKLYRWRSNMLRHRRQECGKEPQFQCPYCPKKTKQKGNLIMHVKTIHSSVIQS
ncbi:hypothetical protein ANN_25134 [Periplaneta americana]|uniref:C2H2-type domain-containing protein n=1 Tax=Periplaneta americana TaxID=6978 RepID=A0ABQ8S0M9_PERAM|nr:hypothetical protein ANN_25134 [Periplaneta americana]